MHVWILCTLKIFSSRNNYVVFIYSTGVSMYCTVRACIIMCAFMYISFCAFYNTNSVHMTSSHACPIWWWYTNKKNIPSSHYKAWAATITQRGSSIINTSITLHHIIQSFPIHSAEYSLMASTQSSKDSMARWPSLLSCTVHSLLWLHGSEIGVCKLFAKSLAIEVCL